jgi:drug/metabolite transporter (DMT)-like permease
MTKANIAGVLAIFLWATLALFTVELKRLPPFQLLFLCFSLATIIGLFGTLRTEQGLKLWRQPLKVYLHGIYGLFLYHLCYFLALRYLPPATALLINALWALLIVLFSALLPNGRLQKNHVVGGVIGLFALTLLVGGVDFGASEKASLGVILALLCAFIWSSYSVSANLLPKVPTESLGGICLAVAMLSFTAMSFTEMPVWDLTLREFAALSGIGFGAMGLAFYAWDFAMKHGNVSLIGAVSYAAPVSATLLLVLFGHAEGSWKLVFAVGLIVLSAVIAARK